MTIKWGDPIECNGVRPDWLRDDERVCDIDPGCATNGKERAAKHWNWRLIKAFCVRSDHPAYVALARGFHPWSGGESAPDDWDATQPVILRNGIVMEAPVTSWRHPWNDQADCGNHDIIGYRKRVEYGAVHTDGSRSGGQPSHLARIEAEGSAPVEGVFIKRMTEAEARQWIDDFTYSESSAHILHALGQLGLVESRAERFTRETGYEVTEAVEAALNWKET